jgi:hypothetical protein
LRCRRARHGPLLRSLGGLGAVRFGRFFENRVGREVHNLDDLLLRVEAPCRAERQQQEQQKSFRQQRQADGERSASGPDTDPFDRGSG